MESVFEYEILQTFAHRCMYTKVSYTLGGRIDECNGA